MGSRYWHMNHISHIRWMRGTHQKAVSLIHLRWIVVFTAGSYARLLPISESPFPSPHSLPANSRQTAANLTPTSSSYSQSSTYTLATTPYRRKINTTKTLGHDSALPRRRKVCGRFTASPSHPSLIAHLKDLSTSTLPPPLPFSHSRRQDQLQRPKKQRKHISPTPSPGAELHLTQAYPSTLSSSRWSTNGLLRPSPRRMLRQRLRIYIFADRF